ncbi:replication initiator protein [Capybara microvirus Cap3_SP_379]|nr:replication initiator protein [Capybara microvirus Cap3_SP_379]
MNYMCLYPRKIRNPRYAAGNKNGYSQEDCKDKRKLYIQIDCGNCEECKRKKGKWWTIRIMEELKINKGTFVTLTFSANSLIELTKGEKVKLANETATKAVRRFLERYRKKHGHSVKHILITELGDEENEHTGRLHLHGILFDTITKEELNELWKYGFVDTGNYCNERTANYITKYILKLDKNHPNYKQKIFVSAGLGKNYTEQAQRQKNKSYRFTNGCQFPLPTYYKNKVFSEEEREQMWTEQLDKNEHYVSGMTFRFNNTKRNLKSKAEKTQFIKESQARKAAQTKNENLGYGNTKKTNDVLITNKMLQITQKEEQNNK